MPVVKEFKIRTDTASLVVFDDDVMMHRFEDYCDWWTLPSAALEEINKGAMFLVGLGSDGEYTVFLQTEERVASPAVRARITSRSSEIRVAPGESLPGEEIYPEGGVLLDRAPGTYEVSVQRVDQWAIAISVMPVEGDAQNDFGQLPNIDRTGKD